MEELEPSEYTGVTPCQDCRRAPVSQTYVNNQTNRQRRVCEVCFILANRNSIILKEEVKIETILLS